MTAGLVVFTVVPADPGLGLVRPPRHHDCGQGNGTSVSVSCGPKAFRFPYRRSFRSAIAHLGGQQEPAGARERDTSSRDWQRIFAT